MDCYEYAMSVIRETERMLEELNKAVVKRIKEMEEHNNGQQNN